MVEDDTPDYEQLRELQKLEQAGHAIADYCPSLWWKLYKGNMASGFTEQQAFELVKVYAHGFAGGDYS